MDSITHIVVGGLVGEVIAGKQLGKRAMVIGAIAQSLPDLDFISSFWEPVAHDLLIHRGITHSISGGVVATVALSLLLQRGHSSYHFSFAKWTLLLGTEIFLHLFLDAFNGYGVGWLEPFSHVRISFNTIFVADPLFTIWPLIVFFIIIFMSMKHTARVRLAWVGLIMSAAYLCFAVANKTRINSEIKTALAEKNINADRFFTTPTAFNTLLWYVVAQEDSTFFVGFRSIFDGDAPLTLTAFPRQASQLAPYKDRDDVKDLVNFSQGYYVVQHYADTLVFNDLRFGQIQGWRDPHEKFVFHYYVNHPDDNLLVIQRGRAGDLSRPGMHALMDRIRR